MVRQWIGALRLRVSLLATLIAVASYRLCGAEIRMLPILAICIICMVTMVHNDYRDRHHDVRKGKNLAFSRPKQFLFLLLLLWTCTLGVIGIVAWANLWTGVLLSGMAAVALAYSETRSIPFMPAIIVSLTSASPALLPLTEGAANYLSIVFFVAIALANYGREIFGDIEDMEIDRGYKHTIPSATSFRHPEKLAGVLMTIGAGLVPVVHPMGVAVAWLLWPMGSAIFLVTCNPASRKRWLWLDFTSALFLGAVIAH